MFRELMQKLRGGGAPIEEQVESEQRHDSLHEERVDVGTGVVGGIVGGEAVGPLGEPTDFTADEEPPADPAP